MPLMYLPFIMFAGFWDSMLQPFGTTPAPAPARAKAVARQPRHRDIDI